MCAQEEPVLKVSHPDQPESQQWALFQIKRLPNDLTNYPLRFRSTSITGEVPQIKQRQPHLLWSRLNDLDRLAISCVIARSPYFMPANDFCQATLQDRDLERSRHAHRHALVIE